MRLSVALCTYNGARHLPAQLDSLLGQARRPDELVVCDDASTDETCDVLARFASTAPFPVSVTRNAVNLGSTPNFEQALRRCTGDVIALCDQDDVWLAGKLARTAAVFEAEPNVGLVACDGRLVGEDLAPCGGTLWQALRFTTRDRARFQSSHAVRVLTQKNYVTGAGLAFAARLREHVLPLSPLWVHDGWLALVAAALAPCRLVAEPLLLYRQHDRQQIGLRPFDVRDRLRRLRQADAADFERQATAFQAVADRLVGLRPWLLTPALPELVQSKVELELARAEMRRSGRLGRLLLGLAQTPRYVRHGAGLFGWQTLAADLWAALAIRPRG